MSFSRFAPIAALVVVVIAVLFANPARVMADDTPQSDPSICVHQIGPGQAYGDAHDLFDQPITDICVAANKWIPSAKLIAMNLLTSLLVIEFIFVGIQTGLFKNDLSELLGTITFKVFVGCLAIWLITNADSWLYGIIQGFEYAGRHVTDVDDKEGYEIGTVINFFLQSGFELAEKAGALQSADLQIAGSNFTSAAAGTTFATTVAQQHNQHAGIMGFLALILLMSAGTILLQYFLITAESFIVMFGGIVLLGFAGSRFTMPFAQGYMSYAVNNGVRFFAFYLVMSVEFIMVGSLTHNAVGSVIHMGDTAYPAFPMLVQSAACVLQTTILASLCWYIPNLAGSLMTGGSAFSAQSMIGNMSGMVAGMQSMIANSQAAKASAAQASSSAGGSGTSTAAQAMNSGHATPQTGLSASDHDMAPVAAGTLGAPSLPSSPGNGHASALSHAAGEGAGPVASGSGGAPTTVSRGGGTNGASASGRSNGVAAPATPVAAGAGNGTVPKIGGAAPSHVASAALPHGLASGAGAGGGGASAAGSIGGDGGTTGADLADGGSSGEHALTSSSPQGESNGRTGTGVGSTAATIPAATTPAATTAGASTASATTPAAGGNLASGQSAGGAGGATGGSSPTLGGLPGSQAPASASVAEAFDESQEASGIRSAAPTGENPTPAVQVRFDLGQR